MDQYCPVCSSKTGKSFQWIEWTTPDGVSTRTKFHIKCVGTSPDAKLSAAQKATEKAKLKIALYIEQQTAQDQALRYIQMELTRKHEDKVELDRLHTLYQHQVLSDMPEVTSLNVEYNNALATVTRLTNDIKDETMEAFEMFGLELTNVLYEGTTVNVEIYENETVELCVSVRDSMIESVQHISTMRQELVRARKEYARISHLCQNKNVVFDAAVSAAVAKHLAE
jgi:hypothetical protein